MPDFPTPSRVVLILFAALQAASSLTDSRPYLAVIEKQAGAVGFYSEDGKLLGQAKVGNFPHEATLSGDGRLLYVSDNGVLWMTEDSMGSNTISVLDTRTMKRVDQIDLGKFHRPHGIAVIPGSNQLLATTERPAGLIRIDPVARKVIRDYDVKGKSPHMVIPLPGGEWAYVSDTDSDAVAVIQLNSGATKLIPTGSRPQGAALSLDGALLYVVNTSGNQISIIDTRQQAVTGVIPTGKGPGRIVITPDGKTLIYNLQFEPGVGFADIATRTQTAIVPLSSRPLSLTMSRDGRRVFAGIQDQDKISFVSVKDRKLERELQLPKGSGPDPAIPLLRE